MWACLPSGLGTVSPGVASAHRRTQCPACPPRVARLPRRGGPRRLGPWTSGPFTIAARIGGSRIQPFLTSIEVAPRSDGQQISLIEPANALTFPVGAGAWAVSDHAETIPVAASGGWFDGRTLGQSGPASTGAAAVSSRG